MRFVSPRRLLEIISTLAVTTTVATVAFVACKAEEKFPTLTDQVASPVDVAVSDTGDNFFVLNADFDRNYNSGSLLVLNTDGEKVGHVLTPRMGRTLVVADNTLLVTFDTREDGEGPLVHLYDVSTPEAPALKAEFDLECSPANAVMRKGYKHFAVTCFDGQLYVGTLADDLSASSLKLVRYYGFSRRALVLDPARELIYAFPTDPTQTKLSDAEYEDVTQYDENFDDVLVDDKKVPNEVPDVMEQNKRQASNRAQRRQYQFIVYDIAAERELDFPFAKDPDPKIGLEERWIYFKLENFDGTPDNSPNAGNPSFKFYRTNFWEAQPDPTDPDVFYLSHRGPPGKMPYANQVVRATLIDDPRTSADGKVPATERFMVFDRVYGFKGQGVDSKGEDNSKFHFPGDIEINEVGGQRLLVVNHFRDMGSNTWKRGDLYFSLAAQVVDDFTWFTEVRGSPTVGDVTTYYQIAMNKTGKAVSCSFYGNAVMLLQVTPGVGIETVKRVE